MCDWCTYCQACDGCCDGMCAERCDEYLANAVERGRREYYLAWLSYVGEYDDGNKEREVYRQTGILPEVYL